MLLQALFWLVGSFLSLMFFAFPSFTPPLSTEVMVDAAINSGEVISSLSDFVPVSLIADLLTFVAVAINASIVIAVVMLIYSLIPLKGT